MMAQVVSGWWLIPVLVFVGGLIWAYLLGVEVGKDSDRITEAFWDGFEQGRDHGAQQMLEWIESAPPMAEGLADDQ